MTRQKGKFTQIPNVILDDLSLDIYEFRILMHIARQTIGYGKKSDGISLTQFVKSTRMSKSKVVTTIAELKKKRLIKVKKQTQPSGRKSYNKYTLSLVHEVDIPTDLIVHEVVNTSPRDGLSLVHEVDIQNTIEQNTIDKIFERERVSSISEEHKMAFILDIMLTEDIKNRQGYEVSMRKKLLNNDKATMEMFDNWKIIYDEKKAFNEFHSSYVGKQINLQAKDKVLTGLVMSISQEGNSFIVAIKDGDDYKSARYRTLDEIRERIEIAA